MKAPSIRISIPKPCTEDWDKMTLEDKGRHCASCNKVVADLTHMTDDEIIAFVAARKDKVCGRMNADQVYGNALSAKRQFGFFTQRFLAAILIAFGSFLFSLDAEAKVAVEKVKMEWMSDTAGQVNKDSVLIRGTVTTADKNERVPFAAVSVYFNDQIIATAKTDLNGDYKVYIKTDKVTTVKVGAYASGFEYAYSKDIAVKKGKSSVANIKLSERRYELMGDIDINYDGH